MRLLILGGTIFLGRHIVAAALSRGHTLSLFNRGQTNPGLFPEVEHLRGDREGQLDALHGRQWDAVIDINAYVPRVARASAEQLSHAVDHYTFISTISVYAGVGPEGSDESGRLAELLPELEGTEEVTNKTYGPLKVLCERAVEAALPGRALIIRPGILAGPHDPTDRFTYWVRRVAAGGDVLAPHRPDSPAAFIDARDIAEWTIRMVEARATGVYNATGPDRPLTLGALLDTCRAVAGSDARFVWVSKEFMAAHDVAPFRDVPLWLPESHAGLFRVRSDRAYAAGLTLRPLADTVRATLEWDRARPADVPLEAGLTPEREAALLAEWKAVAGSGGPGAG